MESPEYANRPESEISSEDHVMYTDHQLLGSAFLRTYWLFQAIFATPIAAALAVSTFVRVLDTHGPVYDVATSLCNAILAAGIVFIVLVQRKVPVDKNLTLAFEIAKSVLATTLWVWLMLDAAIGPQSIEDYYKRDTRVGSAAVSSIALL